MSARESKDGYIDYVDVDGEYWPMPKPPQNPRASNPQQSRIVELKRRNVPAVADLPEYRDGHGLAEAK